MKTFPTLIKTSAKCFALLIMLVCVQGRARAAEVTIAGTTGGCFGAACTPAPPSTGQLNTATLLGLTFNGSLFNGTTSAGFLAIGNVATPPLNLDNLGSFTLSALPAVYTGQTFRLVVTFTAPPGIVGGNPSTFNALLTGSVTTTDTGGAFVNFDNNPVHFVFSNPTSSGSFDFWVNDFSVLRRG